jgi:hypothetical protein
VTKVCENGAAGCASGLLITYTLDPLSRRDGITRPNGAASDDRKSSGRPWHGLLLLTREL